MATRASVTVGPFSVFFTNINRTMRLPGHSHFATVTLVYATHSGHGFPAFARTYGAIQRRLMALTARPFHDMTNEDVAAHLWTAFLDWRDDEVERWGGCFSLAKLELAVRGVPDPLATRTGLPPTRWRRWTRLPSRRLQCPRPRRNRHRRVLDELNVDLHQGRA